MSSSNTLSRSLKTGLMAAALGVTAHSRVPGKRASSTCSSGSSRR